MQVMAAFQIFSLLQSENIFILYLLEKCDIFIIISALKRLRKHLKRGSYEYPQSTV